MTITIHRGTRPGAARAARFDLDVAEWLALRSALLRHAPDRATPAAFDPADFGLDPDAPLDDDERHRAWTALHRRGLATAVPPVDDPAALTPAVLSGLALLLAAEVRVDLQGWSGSRAVTQAVAWSGARTAALARRRCRTTLTQDGREVPVARQEPVVELSLSSGGPVPELLRALPQTAAGPVDPAPVQLGWHESAAVAGALRAGREEVAAHLAGLTPDALAVLGIASAPTGGATLSARRGLGEDVLGFRRVWLWAGDAAVELVTATAETVVLRRTDASLLRRDLLTALTGLVHAGQAA